jgi:hypothetical protein
MLLLAVPSDGRGNQLPKPLIFSLFHNIVSNPISHAATPPAAAFLYIFL